MWGTEVVSWASTRIFWLLGLVFTPAFSKFRLRVSGIRPEGNKEQGWKTFNQVPWFIQNTSQHAHLELVRHEAQRRWGAPGLLWPHTHTPTSMHNARTLHPHTFICTKNQQEDEAEWGGKERKRRDGGSRDGNKTSLNTSCDTILVFKSYT